MLSAMRRWKLGSVFSKFFRLRPCILGKKVCFVKFWKWSCICYWVETVFFVPVFVFSGFECMFLFLSLFHVCSLFLGLLGRLALLVVIDDDDSMKMKCKV